MTSVTNTELERLVGFQILEKTEGQDIYTLILQTKSVELACVADPLILQQLSAAIQKRVVSSDENS